MSEQRRDLHCTSKPSACTTGHVHEGATDTAWVGGGRVGDLDVINCRTKLRVAELGHSKVLLLKRRHPHTSEGPAGAITR